MSAEYTDADLPRAREAFNAVFVDRKVSPFHISDELLELLSWYAMRPFAKEGQ